MGVILIPVNETQESVDYNWKAWRYLTSLLETWGVNLDEFSDRNEGALLSTNICCAVADAIEKHLNELSAEDRAWLVEHIVAWRQSGGFRQL